MNKYKVKTTQEYIEVHADYCDIENGHLIFRRRPGSTVRIFAPGVWLQVEAI
jgi:hypothetical protein